MRMQLQDLRVLATGPGAPRYRPRPGRAGIEE